jgi:hypothetical protein
VAGEGLQAELVWCCMKGLASKSRKSWGWWGAKMNKTEEEILKMLLLADLLEEWETREYFVVLEN